MDGLVCFSLLKNFMVFQEMRRDFLRIYGKGMDGMGEGNFNSTFVIVVFSSSMGEGMVCSLALAFALAFVHDMARG